MLSQLGSLNGWQRQAFSVALLTRMYPNYQQYRDMQPIEDDNLLANQLDLVWQKLAQPAFKFNAEVQSERLEPFFPDTQEHSSLIALIALDFCVGLESLLNSFVEDSHDCAREVSQLSLHSVRVYLESWFVENNRLADFSDSGSDLTKALADFEEKLAADPLFQWEVAMQESIFELLIDSKQTKETCKKLKQLVTQERLSNIGLEY